jgi:hypothetical protein
MKKQKSTPSTNFINEYKRRVGYKINESARYAKLESEDDEYDSLPDNIYMTDGMPTPNIPTHMEEDDERKNPEDEVPEEELPPPDEPAEPSPDDPAEPPMGPPGDEPMPDDVMGADAQPEVSVDEIQNEIIKHNIAAMKAIHDKIESLNVSVETLNNTIATLGSEVEEVKEPTNAEKLMSKKESSYPYYFNLNDFWKDNWFEQKNMGENSSQIKGVVELPDGTFIADFDDLSRISDADLKKSFDKLV